MSTSGIDERSTSLIKGGFILFLSEYVDIMIQLRWMLFLALVLILADLWFGCKASVKQNIPIRRSRAGRRTANKVVDYLVYILLGTSLGKALAEPYGINPITFSVSVLFLCYAFEIDSIYSHICVLHGIKKKISIWSLLKYLIGKKIPGLIDEVKKDSDSTEHKQEKS
jgi:hypothetical protein